MDHITDLPEASGYNSILVVVDRLTKAACFIRARKTDTAKTLASQFTENIFRLHGLPKDIVSDRGTTFTSQWWKEFLQHAKITPNLSTAFHPQTDGQTERVNQVLEQYLRNFCDYSQTNWSELLPMAEFAYNNSYHTSIGMTPFYANHGFHPNLNMSLVPGSVPDVYQRVQQIRSAHDSAAANIKKALERHARYANRKRIEAPEFVIGQLVWLLRKHINTARPSDKLEAKRLGPFTVSRRIGKSAYELKLPSSMELHNVFHVSLLEPHRPNKFASRNVPSQPPPIVNETNEEEWEVDSILDARLHRRRLQYFVTFVGYGPEEHQWVSANDFDDDDQLVLDFHNANPTKPGYSRIQSALGVRA